MTAAAEVRRRAVPLLVVLGGALLLGGCRSGAPPAPMPEVPRVLGFPTIADELARRRERVRSLVGIGKVTLRHGEGGGSARQAIVVERPDRVRLELFAGLGVAAVVTVSDGRLVSWQRAERTAFDGPATAETFGRATGIPLEPGEVVDLLLATPTLGGEPSQVTWEEATGLWRVESTIGDETSRVWVAPGSWAIARSERADADGRRRYAVEFGDRRVLDGVAFPHRVEFRADEPLVEVRIDYEDVTLNGEPAAALFHFDLPDGTRLLD